MVTEAPFSLGWKNDEKEDEPRALAEYWKTGEGEGDSGDVVVEACDSKL